MKRVALLLGAMIPLIGACASTTIKPNPGKHDRGVRYYRPKPYLLIAQAKDQPERYVDIKLDYLPDFEEEYSIRVRTGIGKNKTGIKLDNGWNLSSIDIDVDSQTDENLAAAADLVGSIGSVFKPTGNPLGPGGQPIRVAATNVPLGYYESVISRGPDGKKHLYGWRYVGFGPFSQCPVVSGGLGCTNCQESPLYALVIRDGVMTFAPLPGVELQVDHGGAQPSADPKLAPVPAATPGPFVTPQVVALRQQLPPILQRLFGPVGGDQIDGRRDAKTGKFVVSITLDDMVTTNLDPETRKTLDEELTAKASATVGIAAGDIRIFYPNH